ncbi:phosphate acyltransferase PlsX [Halomonas sediminis]|uniref:Phosphate acyltransferase n=1 Tax=Vreelandella zhuhanensis TaxID=2684210 RepID=A0A7X3KPF6_9GAMM|nr:phosphate acyltransferase PlsX [Halomonas zhuhanensis]MWJ26788.1 phosphate acyltransferase PlsX [Halomonas zhuhanensis]
MRIAIDVMGGDEAPHATIVGAARAALDNPALELLLFGPFQRLHAELSRLPRPMAAATSRLVLCDAPDVIGQGATAAWALRHGKQTSMARMLQSLADGQAQAGVSAGNTAALVALSRQALGTVAGISRPAISTAIPARGDRRCYLLDLGANVDSPATRLVDFALMGAVMARHVDAVAMPRIALLNVGAEATKGSASVRQADTLLRAYPAEGAFTYQGYAEGGDLFSGKLDVVVCDGFVGNAVLKASEGLAGMLVERVQAAFDAHWSGRLASLLARPVLKRLKRELDPVRYNGASLLGLDGIVVKSHGGTGADGFHYAIKRAVQEVEQNLPGQLATQLMAHSATLN